MFAMCAGFRAVGDFSAYRQFQVSFPEIAIEDESAYGAPATSKKKTFTPEEWQAMQKAGTVEVTFYDARECPNCTEKKRLEQLRSQAIKAEVAPPPSSVKIAESKKVFKSLTTKAGAVRLHGVRVPVAAREGGRVACGLSACLFVYGRGSM